MQPSSSLLSRPFPSNLSNTQVQTSPRKGRNRSPTEIVSKLRSRSPVHFANSNLHAITSGQHMYPACFTFSLLFTRFVLNMLFLGKISQSINVLAVNYFEINSFVLIQSSTYGPSSTSTSLISSVF